jgi:RNA polymerase sigma-70 factor (ECF subfamily)
MSPPAASDADLVSRARRGEAAAFEALVRRHYRAAFATAMALTGTREDAEDVCQDAFIKAVERLDDCREPDRFVAWLLGIVRNRAHNHRAWRKVREAEPIDMVEPVSGAPDPHRQAERDDLGQRLEAAMTVLNEKQRQVVLLHDLEGWPHAAIATELGMSEVSSRQYLFTARRLLRERLGQSALEELVNE